MKLRDVEPGQFFTTGDGCIYLKIKKHTNGRYYANLREERQILALKMDRTEQFLVATFAKDGELEVELINPEDV